MYTINIRKSEDEIVPHFYSKEKWKFWKNYCKESEGAGETTILRQALSKTS